MNLEKLQEPFKAEDIEWRVQSAGNGARGVWARVLAYVTSRAIQNRLDDVCGPENWKNEFATGPNGGILCGISIKCGEEWVTKWDGSDNTQIEAVKGGLSGAMKRAGSQWGIGRYLYSLKEGYATISEKGKHYQGANKGKGISAFKWDPPKLPEWALPPKDDRAAKNPQESYIPNDDVKKIYASKDRGELETTWASLSAIAKKNPAVLEAAKEIGIRYPKEEPWNNGQRKQIMAFYGDTPREERIEDLCKRIGRKIKSANELTHVEAEKIIKDIKG